MLGDVGRWKLGNREYIMARMKVDLPDHSGPCYVGEISWSCLIDKLRKAGEFKPSDQVISLEVSDIGIRYVVAIHGNA